MQTTDPKCTPMCLMCLQYLFDYSRLSLCEAGTVYFCARTLSLCLGDGASVAKKRRLNGADTLPLCHRADASLCYRSIASALQNSTSVPQRRCLRATAAMYPPR